MTTTQDAKDALERHQGLLDHLEVLKGSEADKDMQLIRAATAPKQDDIAERLSAAEKLIAVFMEFRFLREDWKVKEALAAYEQRGGA